MARRGCRLDSGCSASRTGIATARWRSMWPSRHATSHRCRATLTSRWARPSGGLTIDFVVVPGRDQLSELVLRVRDGRLRTNIGNVSTLDDAVAAFNPAERRKGKTIIRVHP